MLFFIIMSGRDEYVQITDDHDDSIASTNLEAFDISQRIKALRKKKRRRQKEEVFYDDAFDDRTKYYAQMRRTKQCLICYGFPKSNTYAFTDMWDPITGEREGEDKYGPLVFCAECIAEAFFHKIPTSHLWVPPKGDYQGYYGDALGAGKNFEKVTRGEDRPEWHIFRLPIGDCYLPKEMDRSIITCGPILTDAEINLIDSLLPTPNYGKKFSLTDMKKKYDIAISPFSMPRELYSHPDYALQHEQEHKIKAKAVDQLVHMHKKGLNF